MGKSLKTKTYEFKNVILTEGHFTHQPFDGIITCGLQFQILDMDKETIVKLERFMRMNQLDYVFNIDQNFEKNSLKVDFYKSSGVIGKN